MNTLLPSKGYGSFFRRSKAANSVLSCPIWQKFELVRNFMHVLVTCKYKKGSDQKQPRKGAYTIFPIISQWGFSIAMDTRGLIQSASKHYAAFPRRQVMLHKQFDQDWPTGLTHIQVRKCKIFDIQGQVTPK